MNVKPLSNRIIVQAEEREKQTKGGIFIPDTHAERPVKGTVVAVGDGEKDKPMTVKVGDIVLYGKTIGTEITIEDVEYILMRETDVFAIL